MATRVPRLSRLRVRRSLALEALEDRLVPSGPGTWSTFNSAGPSPRWGAPLVALGPLSVGNTFVTTGTNYFFGGTDGTTTFDDTWAISQATVLATQMQPANSPPARHDQAAVAFDNKMYIFGGQDGSGNTLNDVWAFDPVADSWQQQPSLGPSAWPGAFDATAVAVGQKIILFGGQLANGQNAAATAYEYDPSDGSWTTLAANPLGADASPLAAGFQGQMYVFSSTSATIERLDPVQNAWTALTVQGPAPAPRPGAAGASLSSIFWLTGGAGTGDTWQFNFTTNTWTQKASFPDAGAQFQGAAAFFSFGLPLLMVYGGQTVNPTTHQPAAITDNPIGRLQSVGGVAASDNFPAGVPNLVVPHLVVPEPGGTASFQVELSGASNSADVTVPLSSTNPAEGTVSPAQLVFTSANATTPQTITVTAGNDGALDGDVLYQIQYGPIVSTDPDWSGLTESVPVIARDIPAFTVGSSATFDLTTHGYPVTPSGGTLPSGLSFDSSTNAISGMPAVGCAGSYPLQFQGENPTTAFAFTLNVLNPPAQNPPTVPTATPVAPTMTVPTTTPLPTVSAPPTISLTAPKSIVAHHSIVSFESLHLALNEKNSKVALTVRVTTSHGVLGLQPHGVKVSGNHSHTLVLTGPLAAARRALSSIVLDLGRKGAHATVTVRVTAGTVHEQVTIHIS